MSQMELEPLALLMLATDRVEIAQLVIVDWADSDEDADEHHERLAAWGVGLGTRPLEGGVNHFEDDEGSWAVVGLPNRKVLFP